MSQQANKTGRAGKPADAPETTDVGSDATESTADVADLAAPTLGETDLYLLGEGTHQQLWKCLGARPAAVDGEQGFAFSVWAPNARQVSVVGDFCAWDGSKHPMQRLGGSGVFDLFLPGLGQGEIYKYEIETAAGTVHLKADPMATWAEKPSRTASRTYASTYEWGDAEWMEAHRERDVTRSPMSIYEVHLASWKQAQDLASASDSPSASDAPSSADAPKEINYRDVVHALVEHVKELGFDHVELMPIAEHPFAGSWGYQITGFYAPTARFGAPDDFRYFVDTCHQNGIGVILDWVPAHFVKDAHGLGRFDGTALYEHDDPRRGLHPDWGTYIFNYGRHEVRSFLLSNALYWLEEFHVDGLRMDAVASMLYLDYSREEGEWLPNAHGGRENLDAVSLLQVINSVVHDRFPGRFTIAEESTAWTGVTKPAKEGGLGFTFKWNMGWMHDTLSYFGTDPYFRSGCHDQLTFAMVYEYSERFINPLSHDEVVHGKGSLLGKMPGDLWQKRANLRALLAYQFTRPGKQLLFMGSELAPSREWNYETSLDWHLLGDPYRAAMHRFVCDLGALYREHPCLWRSDPDWQGFQWIACSDHQHSVFCYERRVVEEEDGDRLIVVLNLTPVPREDYRIGAPEPGTYRRLMSTDDVAYGGSGYDNPKQIDSEATPADGCRDSLLLTLPPLAALVLAPGIDPGESSATEPSSSRKDGRQSPRA
ncbi:MAG: 1,4-alpha-glucan branching protein GlgB [Acidobacteriota bacterium]